MRRHNNDRATDLLRVAEGYVGQIHHTIGAAKLEIHTVAEAEQQTVQSSGTGRVGDIGEARKAAKGEMFHSRT